MITSLPMRNLSSTNAFHTLSQVLGLFFESLSPLCRMRYLLAWIPQQLSRLSSIWEIWFTPSRTQPSFPCSSQPLKATTSSTMCCSLLKVICHITAYFRIFPLSLSLARGYHAFELSPKMLKAFISPCRALEDCSLSFIHLLSCLCRLLRVCDALCWCANQHIAALALEFCNEKRICTLNLSSDARSK